MDKHAFGWHILGSIFLLFFYCLWSPMSMAASDGYLGETSQGNLSVTLDIEPQLDVTGFSDIPLGQYQAGGGDLTHQIDICVFFNKKGALDRSYTIRALAGSDPEHFTLRSGMATLPYTVSWSDGTTTLALSPGAETITPFIAASRPRCVGGKLAYLRIQIPESALSIAPAGQYSGTLTITIGSPQ